MLKNGFPLGRFFGIQVSIDWSWLLIFILVARNLAVGVFPAIHPEWSTALTWITAIVAALLFFASVLAHELAHSVVARARGLPVSQITLFLLGGVSKIEREPESAKTEFLMAIVGPLMSLILGVLFLGAGVLGVFLSGGVLGGSLGFLSRLDPVTTLLLWLGPINLVLAVFNMVPGFPLDGGRVLRSIFWATTRNLRTATRWASLIGRGIAWLMILAGIAMVFGIRLPLFGADVIGGIWMAFIGWFLNNAALQSYRQVVLEDMLEGISVASLMHADAVTVSPDMPLQRLVNDYIMKTEERAFPVLDGDYLVGIVSFADVKKVARENWDTTTVAQTMTPADRLAIATPRENASQALNELASRDVRQIPVVQEGRLVGMLRRADIMRYLQMHTKLAS